MELTQPVAELQESVVQALLSLQLRVVPEQEPPEQTSFVVHALPSLHAAEFAGWVHAPPEQMSSVHGFESGVQEPERGGYKQPDA